MFTVSAVDKKGLRKCNGEEKQLSLTEKKNLPDQTSILLELCFSLIKNDRELERNATRNSRVDKQVFFHFSSTRDGLARSERGERKKRVERNVAGNFTTSESVLAIENF